MLKEEVFMTNHLRLGDCMEMENRLRCVFRKLRGNY